MHFIIYEITGEFAEEFKISRRLIEILQDAKAKIEKVRNINKEEDCRKIYLDMLDRVIVEGFQYELTKCYIQLYNKKLTNRPSFYDYQAGIRDLFLVCKGMKESDFIEPDILKMFIDDLSICIGLAGEQRETGYSFDGCDYLRMYSKYLSQEIIQLLLKELKYVRDKNLIILIKSSANEISLDDKMKFKFHYIDLPKISQYIENITYHVIASKYKNYITVSQSEQPKNGFSYILYQLESLDKQSVIEARFLTQELLDKCNFEIVHNKKKLIEILISLDLENEKIEILTNKDLFQIDFYFERESSLIDFRLFDQKTSFKQKIALILNGIDNSDENFEILFFWIDNYRKIKNKSISFSKEYIFSLKDNVLTVSKDKNYIKPPEHFFTINKEKSCIRKINSIIGKNGAGKTSILKFMRDNVFDSQLNSLNRQRREHENIRYIVIIKKGELLSYIINGAKINVIGKDDINIKEYNKDVFDSYTDIKFVFFSNVIDISKKRFYLGEMNTDKSENISGQLVYDEEMKDLFSYEYNQDTLRQLNFLLSNHGQKDISEKEYFYVKIISSEDLLQQLIRQLLWKNNGLHKGIEREFEQIIYDTNNVLETDAFTRLKDFEHAIIYNMYINYKYNKIHTNMRGYYNNAYAELSRAIGVATKDNYEDNDVISLGEGILNFINNNCERISEDEEYGPLGLLRKNAFKFKITDQERAKKVVLVINLLIKTFDSKLNFIIYQAPTYSSGEMAKLNLFSRLHWMFHKEIGFSLSRFENESSSKYILLLLDEVEVFFHPEWQKNFIYDIIHFLETEKNEYGCFEIVDIVLTSNSPFFISDLPKGNLSYIGESDYDENKGTFAQNVHTILSDSFFIGGESIGKFANKKIQDAIKYMENNIETGTHDSEMEYLIGIVSEPILKSFLSQKYRDMCNNERDKIEYDIKQLRQRLSEQEEKLKSL